MKKSCERKETQILSFYFVQLVVILNLMLKKNGKRKLIKELRRKLLIIKHELLKKNQMPIHIYRQQKWNVLNAMNGRHIMNNIKQDRLMNQQQHFTLVHHASINGENTKTKHINFLGNFL